MQANVARRVNPRVVIFIILISISCLKIKNKVTGDFVCFAV
jgi:hypothetical protein